MDANEVKATCDRIIEMYKYDPEEAHIYEDKFLKRILITLAEQIETLSDVEEFQQTTKECISHINRLFNTSRTKWYA